MSFTLPELPYAYEALTPHMSANTLQFHHGKHHNTYVTNLNKLVANSDLANLSLEEIIQKTHGDDKKAGIFNNAAQVWNHSFFWHSMSPKGGGTPTGRIAEKISQDFGSYDAFKEAFTSAATTQFGSGWAWLVLDNGTLSICKTSNAQTPITEGKTPLLTIDVWEHAYYLDYQNKRPDYVTTFLEHLINWEFAEKNMQ